MTRPATIVAIDLGTQSLRINALSTAGKTLWSWQRPVTTHSDGRRQEQDARQWSSLLLAGLDEAAAAGIVPAIVLASGPLAGFVPVSAGGDPLGPAVMYNDSRAEPDVARVEAALGPEASVPRPTIADPLPNALRLMRDDPAIVPAAAHLLDATGWLNFALTGDATLNSYTAMRLYSDAVRKRLGASAAPFGRPVEVGEIIAPLAKALAARLGWPDAPVVATPFDSKCAYLGSGIAAPGEALDISGTVTSFGVVSAKRIVDAERRIYSVPFQGGWLVRGSTAAAGSVLEWAKAVFGLTIDELDALAIRGEITADDPIFVPYLSGARAPLWQPRARGSVSGLTTETSRADLARALYVGLALSLRHIVETIESCGVSVGNIRLCGGLSRSAALSQIKADILSRAVTVLADSEATTMGLAAIGAAALGAFPDIGSAARSFSADAAEYRPRLAPAEAAALYARYLLSAEQTLSPAPSRRKDAEGPMT